MYTTRINVEKYLAEYAIAKWGDEFKEPVRFPDNTDIYHTVYNLTQKRPLECPVDEGNLEIVLPSCTADGDEIRKNPAIYNYLSDRSQRVIDRKLRRFFWSEFHEYADVQKEEYDIEYQTSAYNWIIKYRLTGITEDGLTKHYYRWRREFKRKKTRKYSKKK